MSFKKSDIVYQVEIVRQVIPQVWCIHRVTAPTETF